MMYKEYIVPLFEEENDCGLMINAVIRVQPELIRCKDCKHWDRKDGMFPDIDDNDWHGCEELSAFVSASGDAPCTPAWWYCANAKRKDNG